MSRTAIWVVLAATALLVQAVPVAAHPVPFSYVDLRVGEVSLDATIVVHAYDLAHDLGLDVEQPEVLMDRVVLANRRASIQALIEDRLAVVVDGRAVRAESWSEPEALPDRLSVLIRSRYGSGGPAGSVVVTAALFPYDPEHRTFLNVYEGPELAAQAILDNGRSDFEFFTGTREGALAVVRRFVPSGVHHILIGPDHVLFLVGLLLLGGTLRRLLLVVTGFTVAHSATLSLAALGLVSPPASLIEPAIALSIIYVGVDNLMVRGGRDVRAWIAFGFGLIHGFGFANVLREMDLPTRALSWSLFSFNLGVEIGQVLLVVIVASALAALRARSEVAGRRVAVAGSVVVVAAGAFWFVERVFFAGGAL